MPFSVSPILSINANGTMFTLSHLLSLGVNVQFKMQHTLSIGLFSHSLEQLLFFFIDGYCLTNESSNTLSVIGWMSSFELFWIVSGSSIIEPGACHPAFSVSDSALILCVYWRKPLWSWKILTSLVLYFPFFFVKVNVGPEDRFLRNLWLTVTALWFSMRTIIFARVCAYV